MNSISNRLFEAIVGFAVIIAAILLVVVFLNRTGSGAGSDAIEVTAYFPNASGVNVGTDVRVAGLSVGEVTAVRLNPDDYQAEVMMAIDPASGLPNDSSAAISSEGLLGGSFIALLPGGSPDTFAEGDVILDTQGALDMTSLIGSMINGSGGSSDTMGDTMGGGGMGDTMSDTMGDTMGDPGMGDTMGDTMNDSMDGGETRP